MSKPERGFSLAQLPVFLVVLCITTWAFYEGQRMLRGDLASAGARRQVVLWVAGAASATQAEWDAARDDLVRAVDITPDNPGLVENLGDLYAVAGQMQWKSPELRRQHYAQAESWYRKALALRPSEPQTWASLGMALMSQGEYGDKLHQAWAQAQKLGPNDGAVQPMLLELTLATWPRASNEMQTWAKRLFDEGGEGQRKAINGLAARYGLRFAPDALDATAKP